MGQKSQWEPKTFYIILSIVWPHGAHTTGVEALRVRQVQRQLKVKGIQLLLLEHWIALLNAQGNR